MKNFSLLPIKTLMQGLSMPLMPHAYSTEKITLEQGVGPFQLVYDTYPPDVLGLHKVLQFVQRQSHTSDTKTIILSDLGRSSFASHTMYDQVACLLKTHHVQTVIGIGSEMAHHADRFGALEARFYADVCHLLQALNEKKERFASKFVLVKANPAVRIEQVAQHLAHKQHRTVLEVNLDHLSNNLKVFRDCLSPTTKVMAVLKASAYGSGGAPIARFLEHSEVDCIGVVYTDEAVELRRAGIRLPILVMNPTPTDGSLLQRYDLMAEVYSMRLLEGLQQAAQEDKTLLKVHLKLDTGMHRLGFSAEQVDALIKNLHNAPNLRVVGIMSHLAVPEAPEHDPYSHKQYHTFVACAARIENALRIRTVKHLLSSIGVLRHGQFQLDMVRVGIGLYGVGTVGQLAPDLIPTHTLKATVAQVKHVAAGATVGYGRAVQLSRDTQVAVLTIGYADGFSRALSHGQGGVWLHGHFAPVLGSVCMDMCMVDATHLPAKEGDQAIVFDREHRLEVGFKAAHTLPNEMLSCIGERVRRVYIGCGDS